MADFNQTLHDLALLDLGHIGPPFTWHRGMILHKRLERVVATIEWINLFPKAVLWHLPLLHSDHNPIFISLNCQHQIRRNGFFRQFERWWSTIQGTHWEIQNGWRRHYSQLSTIGWQGLSMNLIKELSQWIKNMEALTENSNRLLMELFRAGHPS